MKTWFVTGASTGLGRCIAEAALYAGDNVAVASIDPENMQDYKESYGDKVLVLDLDITKPDKVKEAFTKAINYFGQVDVLVNNAGFIVTALDFKNGWSDMNKLEVIESCILFLFGYGMYMEVLRENRFLSRTVEVQEEQEVIDTGLYSIVRHPMYLATILMFLAIPLVLGSTYGLIVFLPYPFLIAKRIENEEEVLEKGLKGYKEYKKKVKYRLIPYVW